MWLGCKHLCGFDLLNLQRKSLPRCCRKPCHAAARVGSFSKSGVPVGLDFGDGTSSTEESPTHVYSASGDYEVSLIWQGLCALDTVAMSVNVPDLVFDFSVSGPNTLDCSSTDSQVVVNLGEAESATFESNTLSTSLPLVGANSVTWDIESGSDGWNFYSITVAQADCIETYTDSVFVVSGVEVDYTLSPEVVCQGEPVTLTVFYGVDVVISSPVPTNLANSPNFVPLDIGAGYTVFQSSQVNPGVYGFQIVATNAGCEEIIADEFSCANHSVVGCLGVTVLSSMAKYFSKAPGRAS